MVRSIWIKKTISFFLGKMSSFFLILSKVVKSIRTLSFLDVYNENIKWFKTPKSKIQLSKKKKNHVRDEMVFCDCQPCQIILLSSACWYTPQIDRLHTMLSINEVNKVIINYWHFRVQMVIYFCIDFNLKVKFKRMPGSSHIN